MKIGKWKIEFNTFLKKKTPKIDDSYGMYCITGKQGSGKTYYAVKMAINNQKKVKKIITNIKSLKIAGVEIEYFTKISEIYFNKEEYCMFIIDEISRKYNKNSKTDDQFYAFLNQCRKTHRMCILITQEYKELPMWLRRPIKYNLSTRPTFILGRLGIFSTNVGDGENPILDKDTMEWECPVLYKIISKRNKEIAKHYDTFETIEEL